MCDSARECDYTHAMIHFLAVYLVWIQIALLIFLGRSAIWGLLAAIISSPILAGIIRFFYHHPSFPSDHAAFMFALATAIFIKHRRWGAVMYVLAITTSVARVMADIHRPSDIIAGAVLGITVGYAVRKFSDTIN